MKKNYVVKIESEVYTNYGKGKYRYEHLTNKSDDVYFENLDDAIKFVDNYNLEICKNCDLYVDYLSIFKFNEEDEEIEGDVLYDKGISYEEIENQEGVKMAHMGCI